MPAGRLPDSAVERSRFRNRDPFDVVLLDEEGDRASKKVAPARRSGAFRSRLSTAFNAAFEKLRIDTERPIGMWSGAAALTVLVHVLFIGSLTLGTGKSAASHPLNEGFHAVGRNADGSEIVSVLFFVEDKSIHPPEDNNESAYMASENSLNTPEDNAMVSATDTGSAPAPSLDETSDSPSEEQTESGDGAEAARLYGRYMGQIKARIERAWEYPATVKATQCRVQIRQSKEGAVKEITVQRCDLPPDLQMTLVRAIEFASPLSAPPSEKVFTDVVTLTFTASPLMSNSMQ